MNDQRQLSTEFQLIGAPPDVDAVDAAAARLAAARGDADRLFAAADAILANIASSDSQRFLSQVRQSGGE